MPLVESMLNSGEQITFSVLFIGLMLYVIKTNDAREGNYRETIKELTSALNGFEDLKESIKEIRTKVGL